MRSKGDLFMIIEICSQNRALEEVANMRTGEPVSIISIVSSDEKDVEFDADDILTHQRFAPNRLVYMLACKELGITPGSHPVPATR